MLDEHLKHKSQIEDGAKKKCLEEKNDEIGESIGDDEYEKRFQTDIEKAVCQSLGSLKKHYGLLSSTDTKDEMTSRLDAVHLYVIIQLDLENPVDDAEMGVSTSAYELKQHLVALLRKIVEDLEHERQIKITNQVRFVLSFSYRNEDLHFLPFSSFRRLQAQRFRFNSEFYRSESTPPILELCEHVKPFG
ncbi:hypothetical protein Q3G72_030724 [Acer saccharum]|nr:hypothetical protein Q3G72_030724 [Acer saccharum]